MDAFAPIKRFTSFFIVLGAFSTHAAPSIAQQTVGLVALEDTKPVGPGDHVWNLRQKKDRQEFVDWINLAGGLSTAGFAQYTIGTGVEVVHRIQVMVYLGVASTGSAYNGGIEKAEVNVFPTQKEKRFFLSGKIYRLFMPQSNHFEFIAFATGMDLTKDPTLDGRWYGEIGIQLPTSQPSIPVFHINSGVPYFSIGFKIRGMRRHIRGY